MKYCSIISGLTGGSWTATAMDITSSTILAATTIAQPQDATLSFTAAGPSTRITLTATSSISSFTFTGIPLNLTSWTAGTIVTTVCSKDGDAYRYGFNGQMKDNEIAGVGNWNSALYWEYATREAQRKNLDPEPNPSISPYVVFDGNPIWKFDILGNVVETYGTAVASKTTLTEKGGTQDNSKGAVNIKEAKLIPAMNKEGNIVGYNIWDTKDPGAQTPLLQMDAGDMQAFKDNYSMYMDQGRASRDGSPGLKKMGEGLAAGNVSTVWQGVKQENAQFFSNPLNTALFLVGLGEMRTPVDEVKNEVSQAKSITQGTYASNEGAPAVHGNSLSSQRPTWGYKLYSNDGTFLKNGITSKPVPQTRYPKAFMKDKYMVPYRLFPNRLEAYQWEYQENLIQRGPLNKNMH